MAILKVAQIGHPVLRQTARLVTREELHTQAFQSFIDSMIETKHDASSAGLAANQVHSAVQVRDGGQRQPARWRSTPSTAESPVTRSPCLTMCVWGAARPL